MTDSKTATDTALPEQTKIADTILGKILAGYDSASSINYLYVLEDIAMQGPLVLRQTSIDGGFDRNDKSDFLHLVIKPVCAAADLEMERKCVLALIIRMVVEKITSHAIQVFSDYKVVAIE